MKTVVKMGWKKFQTHPTLNQWTQVKKNVSGSCDVHENYGYKQYNKLRVYSIIIQISIMIGVCN